METESARGKKKEILDLLKNYNKLRSEEEFKEIKDELHRIKFSIIDDHIDDFR